VKKLSILLFLSAILSGCFGSESKEETHDISWYLEHKTERLAKMKECLNNPGELRGTPNCVNSIKANAEASMKNF